jgi:carboxyl-terminal processing protease
MKQVWIRIGIISSSLLLPNINNWAQTSNETDKYFEISKNLELYGNIYKELNQYYVDPIQPGKMFKIGVDAMLKDLDPYTNVITEAEAEEYELQSKGRYSGVGIGTKIINGEFHVTEVMEQGPMDKAGVKVGDVVISVDGQKLKGKTNDEAGMLMRGAIQSTLTTVIRSGKNGQESTKTIMRDEIKISSVPYSSLIGPQKNIAYVFLSQFTPNCSRDVRQALDSLKKAEPNLKGVVLDLRGNPGGLLDEAVNVCNLFLNKDQLIVTTKGKNKEWEKTYATKGMPWDASIPLTVLISNTSASASEIVSGTTQDLDRGIIIGTRSFGKGLVQNVRNIGYNTRLKLTTAKYYTPSGRCIQAMDYSHRNEDGSVAAVPDSLKKMFKTTKGRKVYDGGGIEPDFIAGNTDLSSITKDLIKKNYIFNYATHYYHNHTSIASAEEFRLTDKDFIDFEQWLNTQNEPIKTNAELLLDSVKTQIEKEKNYSNVQNEIQALQLKLSSQTKQDITKQKNEILTLLNQEIVSRYYYQKGKVVHKIYNNDQDIIKALEVLNDKSLYQKTLQ